MPHVLAAAGSAILAATASAAASAGTVAVVGGTLSAIITAAGGLAAGLFGVTAIGGAFSIATAVTSWSTVATLAAAFMRSSNVGKGQAGTQVDFQADPNAGIPLILGRSATAGKVLHANTTGASNKNAALYYLMALTGGPLGSFESFIASQWPCTFDGIGLCTGPAHYAGQMYLEVTPGAKPDAQAYYPGGVQLDWITEWTPDHMLSGVACAWWTLVYNTKAFPQGMPKPLFVLRGPPVYDPRADSTFPGGSGPQRWNDPSTWTLAGNDNPFLQALAWCIGRYDNGHLTFGIGAPIEAIDLPAFVEGANVCDANLWMVGGEVLSSDKKWDVLTTILQAGGGEPIKLGGQISCYVRSPKVALTTMSGQDLVDTASITGTKRRRDRINQIIPNYRSELHGWQMVPAGAVFVQQYIDADGGLRSREGNYPLVQDAKQVAQLATYDLLDAREFEPVVLPVGPRWQTVRPGDCILVNEPEFGLLNQPVIIQTRELDLVSGKVTLTCRSETPGKHDYALGRTPNPPPIPGLQPTDPGFVAQPDAGTWTATGGVLTGADGSQVPAIVVTGHVNDPNVSGVIVDWALELTTGPPATFGVFASLEVPASTRRIEIRAVVGGATYHVQVRYRSVRNVEGALALDLGLVTVGTSISGGVTQIGGQTPQDLIDQLNETTATANQAATDLIFTNANLYESTHLPDGTDLETYVVNNVTTLTQGNTYAVTRVDAIGILQPDGRSFVMNDATLFASPGVSWGQYRTTVSTQVGQNTASIVTQQTSIDGLNAQWVLSVSSQGPGYARVAGIKVAANPTVSSIAFVADQIGFTDGTSNVFPLAVQGGKVIATNFQADDIKANTITTNKIVANNIDVTVLAVLGAQLILTPAPQFAMSGALTTGGGYVEVDVWGNVSLTGSGGSIGTMFDLYCDGALVQTFGVYCFQPVSFNSVTFRWRHRPAAGAHTYQVNGYKQNGGGPPVLTMMLINLTEKKTQA